jgi:hypothetical protein
VEVWQAIPAAILVNATLVAVLGWLAKSLVESQLAKDTATFKVKLAADTDSAIERLKHEFELITVEHQIRLHKLHEKRAEVVAELYGRLAES